MVHDFNHCATYSKEGFGLARSEAEGYGRRSRQSAPWTVPICKSAVAYSDCSSSICQPTLLPDSDWKQVNQIGSVTEAAAAGICPLGMWEIFGVCADCIGGLRDGGQDV